MLGGSAVHFSLAASFFTEARVVGPVGDDFGDDELAVLEGRGVVTDDIERVEGGADLLLAGPLRVRHERRPHRRHPAQRLRRVRPEALARRSRAAEMLMLGNIQPDLQRRVRAECEGAEFAALDSMNLWIDTAPRLAGRGDRRGRLRAAERRRDPDAHRASRTSPGPRAPLMEMGPKVVVAKRGEYGAALFTADDFFAIPGFLLEDVRDPTGAGDSFAGGFLGYLDKCRGAGDSRPRRRRTCARRWPTGRCSPRSTSRTSAPRGSRR